MSFIQWNPATQAWPGGPHPGAIAAMQQAAAIRAVIRAKKLRDHLLLLRR